MRAEWLVLAALWVGCAAREQTLPAAPDRGRTIAVVDTTVDPRSPAGVLARALQVAACTGRIAGVLGDRAFAVERGKDRWTLLLRVTLAEGRLVLVGTWRGYWFRQEVGLDGVTRRHAVCSEEGERWRGSGRLERVPESAHDLWRVETEWTPREARPRIAYFTQGETIVPDAVAELVLPTLLDPVFVQELGPGGLRLRVLRWHGTLSSSRAELLLVQPGVFLFRWPFLNESRDRIEVDGERRVRRIIRTYPEGDRATFTLLPQLEPRDVELLDAFAADLEER